jgi:hypothetical protein
VERITVTGNPLLRFNASMVVTDKYVAEMQKNKTTGTALQPVFYWPNRHV